MNYGDSTVTKITPDGTPSTFAAAGSEYPMDIAIDAVGNLYTANSGTNTVTKITPGGSSSVFAATGSYPAAITIDAAGNLYTANSVSSDVTKITPDGTPSLFAATGTGPTGITLDAAGNLYTANIMSDTVTRNAPDIYPAPPTRAAAPSASRAGNMAMLAVTRNGASGRHSAPTSYLVRAVGDPSKQCVVGFTGAATCRIANLAGGTTYTFEVIARRGTWSTAASAASAPLAFLAGPDITGAVSPASGPTAGGTAISITGTDFQQGATVTVGGNNCATTSVAATSITCTTQAHAAGATDVVVTNPDTQADAATGAFSFVDPPAASEPAPAPQLPGGASEGGVAPAVQSPSLLGEEAVPPLAARAPVQRGGSIVTTGVVPEGATSVVQVARTGAAALSRPAGIWANARVITKCPITVRGSTRVFACRTHLAAGAWVITTQARHGTTVLASVSRRVVVKAALRTVRRTG